MSVTKKQLNRLEDCLDRYIEKQRHFINFVKNLYFTGEEPEANKDVHTKHCCLIHGCKYYKKDCTVESQSKQQSFLCEMCEDAYED